MRRILALLAVVSLSVAAEQTGPSAAAVTIQRIDVRNLPAVSVYLTVTDAAGRSVLGLTPNELVVSLDGQLAPGVQLRSALEGGEHLAVALAFDRSGSMKAGVDSARQAALEFVSRLSERDEVAVISFDDQVRVEAGLTTDRAVSRAALEGIQPGSNTALHDAMLEGLDLLAAASTGRRALVVLSDGKDTRSSATRDAAIQRARAEGVPIYTIGLPLDVDADALDALAAETGGSYLSASAAGDLLLLYQLLAEQLQNQYFLEFRVPAVDEQWHRLSLRLGAQGSDAVQVEREFIATTGPGISAGRLHDLRTQARGVDERLAGLVGGLAGLLIGMMMLLGVRAIRPEAAAASLAGFTILLLASALGVVAGLVYAISSGGGW